MLSLPNERNSDANIYYQWKDFTITFQRASTLPNFVSLHFSPTTTQGQTLLHRSHCLFLFLCLFRHSTHFSFAVGPRQGCQMAKFDPFLSLDCARVEGRGAHCCVYYEIGCQSSVLGFFRDNLTSCGCPPQLKTLQKHELLLLKANQWKRKKTGSCISTVNKPVA